MHRSLLGTTFAFGFGAMVAISCAQSEDVFPSGRTVGASQDGSISGSGGFPTHDSGIGSGGFPSYGGTAGANVAGASFGGTGGTAVGGTGGTIPSGGGAPPSGGGAPPSGGGAPPSGGGAPPSGGGAPPSGGGGSGGVAPGNGTCCAIQPTPTCSNSSISSCVCAIDPYCCTTSWDQTCVAEVNSFGCGNCGTTGSGNCCSAHVTPGCTNPSISSCVCGLDPYCCTNEWDSYCADEVLGFGCGIC